MPRRTCRSILRSGNQGSIESNTFRRPGHSRVLRSTAVPANRRKFLLTLAGSTLGKVVLSSEPRIPPAPGELPTTRLVTVPARTMNDDGTFLLVWSEETD